jgi:DNA-binding MarR family transcriptional regulator
VKSSTDGQASTRAAHESRLYHQLQLAAHLSRKHADREVSAATGLTVAQVAVLHAIAASGDATQRDVAAQLGVNESAVTPMVRRLVESGHVTRADRDGRTRRLTLTDLGATAVRASRRAFRPVNQTLAGELTAAEVDELARQLKAIVERLASSTS